MLETGMETNLLQQMLANGNEINICSDYLPDELMMRGII